MELPVNSNDNTWMEDPIAQQLNRQRHVFVPQSLGFLGTRQCRPKVANIFFIPPSAGFKTLKPMDFSVLKPEWTEGRSKKASLN